MSQTTGTTGWRTPQDLSQMTGFSVTFIRNEIKAGTLKATLVRSPSRQRQRGRWRIAEGDALDYCGRLGFHTIEADAGDAQLGVVECATDAP
jgi:hypothetical protein